MVQHGGFGMVTKQLPHLSEANLASGAKRVASGEAVFASSEARFASGEAQYASGEAEQLSAEAWFASDNDVLCPEQTAGNDAHQFTQ